MKIEIDIIEEKISEDVSLFKINGIFFIGSVTKVGDAEWYSEILWHGSQAYKAWFDDRDLAVEQIYNWIRGE